MHRPRPRADADIRLSALPSTPGRLGRGWRRACW